MPHRIVLSFTQRNMPSKYTYVGIKFLLSIIEENPVFAQSMMSRRQDWAWIDTWLKTYVGRRQAVGSAPPLNRQESREETFTKYQTQLEKLGATLVEDPKPSEGGGADAVGPDSDQVRLGRRGREDSDEYVSEGRSQGGRSRVRGRSAERHEPDPTAPSGKRTRDDADEATKGMSRLDLGASGAGVAGPVYGPQPLHPPVYNENINYGDV